MKRNLKEPEGNEAGRMTEASEIIREDADRLARAELPWERLAGKTVLVAGAAGYVPAYFVHALMRFNDLRAAGIKVSALCRNEARARARFGAYLGRADFRLLLQDVRQPARPAGPVHFIIHAASPAGAAACRADLADTFAANVEGCRNLLELGRRKGSEGFLFVSSVDVYGLVPVTEAAGADARLTEDQFGALDWLHSHNVYAAAKRAAETLTLVYQTQYGLPTVLARPAQVLGPGAALGDSRLHIDFIGQMLAGDRIVLKSDGRARRSFIYVADAVAGMLLALLRGEAGLAYNVADEAGELSVRELAELMAGLVPGRKIEVEFDLSQRETPAVKLALPRVLPSSARLRALGWRPQVTLKEGLARMMASYGLGGIF
jgi:nucleoside-diphosphate-sugar epimerase